jgi:WD40 repeat protein
MNVGCFGMLIRNPILVSRIIPHLYCRLKGHKNMITDLCFIDDIKGQSYLISSSKDGLLKIWDLSLKACVDTVVDHAAEVSRIVYVREKGLVITGSVDSEIRLFKLKQENEETDSEEDVHRLLSLHGSILRKSTSRIVGFSVSRPFPGEIVLGLASSDKSFELFRFLKSEELEKKLSRKKKRLREKGKMDVDEEPQLSDLESVYSYFCDYKIGSFTFGKCNTGKKCIEVTIINKNQMNSNATLSNR